MRRTLTTLLLAAGCFTIHAAPITQVRQNFVYEISKDGTWTTDIDVARRIDEIQAVSASGQAPLQYSDSMQKLEVLEAYTVTKDGKRIDVAADKIFTQALPASVGAPTFSDTKLRMVIFPQVEVGATLALHYRIKQIKPFLPGVISAVVTFNPFLDTQTGSVTVRAPENLKLHVSSRTVQGGEVKSKVRGMREWHWDYNDVKAAYLPEAGSVVVESFSPYAAFSTLETYPELATAYMIGADAAAKVTPAVQKLADEITTGITDKRKQADALYRWVGTEIRYVAIAIGAGGFVPHQADEVIAARYGDCKDKSTLLMALLHAKGIRAQPVLIHTADSYKLPDTVLLGAFNHAINYLPDWDLYVDSTSGFTQFGTLTSNLMSRPALLGGDKSGIPVVKITPVGDPARDRMVQRTVATLAADGTVSGANHLETLGSAEPALRGSLGNIPVSLQPNLAKAMLSSTGQTGDATLAISDARDLTKPFTMALDFKVPRLVNVPGPGALPNAFGMTMPAGAQAYSTAILQTDRKLDFPCPQGAGMEEVIELQLPAEVTISTLPKASAVGSPYGRFTATYEVKDGKLLVNRKLDSTPPRAVCTAADYAELRKFATAINQQLRAQLLYQ